MRACLLAICLGAQVLVAQSGAAMYRNPVIFGDYSDPDVIRVGGDFYLVSSSFNTVPALPILHSRDLVHWTIVGHAAARLPSPRYDTPQHGNGVWAPSIRFHDGRYWIYFGDPDLGIFMTTARDPRGPWDPLTLVAEGKGWIDPCPLWDDDGRMYLVHAWAKSRAGFNSVLSVRRLTADGQSVAVEDRIGKGTVVFDGTKDHPTIEGPKFYKRNGFYYIFAPAGGVANGWQTVLRAKSVFGPYEDRIVLARGGTDINGPHQGAWVEMPGSQQWFVHFQDRGAYGRVVHLQSLTWKDDWPLVGYVADGERTGIPVQGGAPPALAGADASLSIQTSDEFSRTSLGLQWQWQANPSSLWASLDARPNYLRLSSQPILDEVNLWNAPHLLLQKLPAEAFVATVSVDPNSIRPGEAISWVTFGMDYASLRLSRAGTGWKLEQIVCKNAMDGATETVAASVDLSGPMAAGIELRLVVAPGGVLMFSYRAEGKQFAAIGDRMTLREGRWMGAKFGLIATRPIGSPISPGIDIDWVRVIF